MIGSRRYAAAAFAIGVAACAVDVVSKILVVAELSGRPPMTLLGGLITLQLYRDAGAAFGVGPSFTAVYALVAAAVLVAILRVSGRLRSWLWAAALGLLLGGAAGNLADRVFRSPAAGQGTLGRRRDGAAPGSRRAGDTSGRWFPARRCVI